MIGFLPDFFDVIIFTSVVGEIEDHLPEHGGNGILD